jgi:uncharacterized protein (UPF0248 family)
MAETTSTIRRLVSSLTERLECELLTYNPTNSVSVRPGGPQRYLFPTGPYALELCHPGDDVHLVCLTDNSSNTFWEYIAEKLDREDLPKHDCIISRPGDEVTVWLHYCGIPPYFDIATVGAYGFPKHPESTFVPQVVRLNLARLQDTWHLLDRLGEDLDTFRHDYNILRRWAEAAGIFSKAFGTLDAESLVWMLFNAKSVTVDSDVERKSTLSTGIQSFMAHHSVQSILTPSGRSVHDPPPHIAANSHATIESEIDQLSQNPDLISLSPEQHYQRFCQNFQATILVSAECWAVDRQRETFHSQLTTQITQIAKHLHDLRLEPQDLRFWPHASKPSEDEWLYAVGINRLNPKIPSPQTADLQTSLLPSHLDLPSFLGLATLNLCPKEQALALPTKHVALDPSPPPSQICNACALPLPSPPSPSTPTAPSSNKFPPAAQVLSRLRWDPAHKPFDYEVGYLDRFEGLMWLPMEQWGKATEEEDFIPEHRIRVFRRVERDGGRTVVWDREGRVCGL